MFGGVNKEKMKLRPKELMRECVKRFGKDWQNAKISIDAYGDKPSLVDSLVYFDVEANGVRSCKIVNII